MAMQHLFIYGTLAPGKPNHHIVEPIGGHWQRGYVKGTLYEAGWGAEMGCPGIKLNENGELVAGWLLSSEQLETFWPELDKFEGDEYSRVLVEATTEFGEKIKAYIYCLSYISSDKI